MGNNIFGSVLKMKISQIPSTCLYWKKHIINSWKQKEESCVYLLMKEANLKRLQTVWFYLYNSPKEARLSRQQKR